MATHIHALAFDHIKIGLQGLGELLEHIHHYKIQGIAHLPQIHLATLTFPSIQPSLQLVCWQALGLGAVHQFIGATAPHINGPDSPALGEGQQQGA